MAFTASDAQIVLGILVSVLVPFIVELFSTRELAKGVKLGIAFVIAIIGGALTEFVAGRLGSTDRSIVEVIAGVFFASQIHFATWFRSLGLDNKLNQSILLPPDENVE